VRFEEDVPPVATRIGAMRRVAEAGYPIRAVLMPLVPVAGWETAYGEFLRDLLSRVPLERLTLGGLCSYPNARSLMERRLGRENEISRRIAGGEASVDGRARYPRELRVRMYAHLARVAREVRPDLDLALCLEEAAVWKAVGLEENVGRCNCVL